MTCNVWGDKKLYATTMCVELHEDGVVMTKTFGGVRTLLFFAAALLWLIPPTPPRCSQASGCRQRIQSGIPAEGSLQTIPLSDTTPGQRMCPGRGNEVTKLWIIAPNICWGGGKSNCQITVVFAISFASSTRVPDPPLGDDRGGHLPSAA